MRKSFYKHAAAILHAAFWLAIAANGAAAQVVYDSTSGNSAFSNTGVAELTWNHTVTDLQPNRALFVAISTTADPLLPSVGLCNVVNILCQNPLPGSNLARVASVTYNGDMMQPVGSQISPDLRQSVEIYRLFNPDAGAAYQVRVILNPASVFQVVGGSNSFTGVSSTTPNGAFRSAFGTNNQPTIDVLDAVAGDFVLDAVAVPPAALAAVAGANQLERYNGFAFFNNAYSLGAGSTEPGAAGTETMSWMTTNPSNWAIAAIAVRQNISTAAQVSISGRVMSSGGKPVARARVIMTAENGAVRYATANPFGYFRFNDVAAGATYIFDASAKRHSFSSRAITVNDGLSDLIIRADF